MANTKRNDLLAAFDTLDKVGKAMTARGIIEASDARIDRSPSSLAHLIRMDVTTNQYPLFEVMHERDKRGITLYGISEQWLQVGEINPFTRRLNTNQALEDAEAARLENGLRRPRRSGGDRRGWI